MGVENLGHDPGEQHMNSFLSSLGPVEKIPNDPLAKPQEEKLRTEEESAYKDIIWARQKLEELFDFKMNTLESVCLRDVVKDLRREDQEKGHSYDLRDRNNLTALPDICDKFLLRAWGISQTDLEQRFPSANARDTWPTQAAKDYVWTHREKMGTFPDRADTPSIIEDADDEDRRVFKKAA